MGFFRNTKKKQTKYLTISEVMTAVIGYYDLKGDWRAKGLSAWK